MLQTLQIRAFFFNAKTDYLPYYKQFSIIPSEYATAKDILAKIKEINENFSFPEQALLMRINGWAVEGGQSVASLVERLGLVWQIDPVNSYRSNNGLCINDDDFMQSYALLEPYATPKDLAFYEGLYALHYASRTHKFDHDYIGDAVLVLAHKMISEGSEHKDAILHAITSAQSGLFDCEYENTLFNAQHHTQAINALKAMLDDEEPSFCSRLMARFCSKEQTNAPKKNPIKTIDALEEKHIAHYHGHAPHDTIHALVTQKGMKGIHFSLSGTLCGVGILKDSKTLAFKKAGAVLLDAFDHGAEVLVVEDKEALEMFTKHFSAIEKTVGRKMIGLELISSADFIAQVGTVEA